eukprot:3299863-Prymnesium_polylepis.1
MVHRTTVDTRHKAKSQHRTWPCDMDMDVDHGSWYSVAFPHDLRQASPLPPYGAPRATGHSTRAAGSTDKREQSETRHTTNRRDLTQRRSPAEDCPADCPLAEPGAHFRRRQQLARSPPRSMPGLP